MDSKTLAVFGITKIGDKSYWNRIGSAWENRDGSINVQLNFLPLDGKLNIREQDAKSNGQEKT